VLVSCCLSTILTNGVVVDISRDFDKMLGLVVWNHGNGACAGKHCCYSVLDEKRRT